MPNIFRRSQFRKVSERSTPVARIWAGSFIDNGKGGTSDLIANEFWEFTATTEAKTIQLKSRIQQLGLSKIIGSRAKIIPITYERTVYL